MLLSHMVSVAICIILLCIKDTRIFCLYNIFAIPLLFPDAAEFGGFNSTMSEVGQYTDVS